MTMNHPARTMLAIAAFAGLSACLAACHKDNAADRKTNVDLTGQTATGADTHTAAPGGRLVLPVIAGRPAAAYIAWRNTGAKAVTITGITIEGAASADMHETKGGAMTALPKLKLAPGEDANFAPGGRHVMVYGVPANAKAGGTVAYQLSLSDGGKLAGTLTVEAAGSAHDTGAMGHDMNGMKM